MSYGYRRGRRENPYAAERREREEKQRARIERSKARFYRLMRQYRKIFLVGEASNHAWKQPVLRTYETGMMNNGDIITATLRKGEGGKLYLQESGGMGWNFYRLVPKHHALRQGEWGTEHEAREALGVRDRRGRSRKHITRRSRRASRRGKRR